MTVLALATLGLLVVAAAYGTVNALRWHRFDPQHVPVTKLTLHVTLQLVAVALWSVFLSTEEVVVAWIAFAVLTLGQGVGDVLMFASHRARHRTSGKVAYLQVALDVLRFRRPAAALHAIIGASAYFLMLVTCVLAST